MSPGSCVFLALDGLSLAESLTLSRAVAGRVAGVKIHDLYDAHGPFAVKKLTEAGVSVWVDLKFHDIPQTVFHRAYALRKAGARIITAHASGGRKMLAEAVRAAGDGMKVYAVTLLTSLDEEDAKRIYGGTSDFVVMNLVKLALAAQVSGIVCSPQQVGSVRKLFFGADLDLVVPGSRSPGVDHHDQKQVGTPAATLAVGATHVVIGRQVTTAPDPLAALEALEKEIESV